MQTDWAVLDWYQPAAQEEQDEAPAAVTAPLENLPMMQFAQVVALAAAAYWPAGHEMHTLAAAAE